VAVLAVRGLLAPCFVVLASLAARRFGARAGGVVAGLPVIAGPILLVLAITAVATRLGPHLSGLISAFPIITAVLTAFTHAQQGPTEAIRLLRGFTVGFFAYAVFCVIVATSVRPLGIAPCFVLATAAALAAQAAALAAGRRSLRNGRRVTPRQEPAVSDYA
jgi:hypothetical protein